MMLMLKESGKSNSKDLKHLPWIEKYRPKKIANVAHQDEVTRIMKTSLEQGSLPHLLFYGPPGTGKTSTIIAMAHELFGPDTYKDRVLELNASDERGIDVVREKIKNFARVAVGRQGTGGYPCPPFKLIVLDEADSMTVDAQSALRRTMETYSKSTRFCLICNYVSRIIEPIASRCAKFRFKPLPSAPMLQRLHEICDAEGVKVSGEALDALIQVSGGDMRKAVNLLQNGSQLYRDGLTPAAVMEISGSVPPSIMTHIWTAARKRTFTDIESEVQSIMSQGYAIDYVLFQLVDQVINSSDLTDVQKAAVCQEIAGADKCLVDGADEYLQLLRVVSSMSKYL